MQIEIFLLLDRKFILYPYYNLIRRKYLHFTIFHFVDL